MKTITVYSYDRKVGTLEVTEEVWKMCCSCLEVVICDKWGKILGSESNEGYLQGLIRQKFCQD